MSTSLKSLLMPALSQHLLSRRRLLHRRARAEALRVSRGQRHQVHYFHQVDDPYSALAAACLPRLATRYDIEILPHVVGPPPDAAGPERDRLVAYSRKDAQALARHWGLNFDDTGSQPSPAAVQWAGRMLVAAIDAGSFVELAGPLSACLWRPGSNPYEFDLAGLARRPVEAATLAAHNEAADRLRLSLGHYLGATFYYGGEWYWGIDRLHHLERRLQDLGAQRSDFQDLMFPPGTDLRTPRRLVDPPPLDFYFSLRSPYSAIVAQRVFDLGRLTGMPVRLRYVLPMVMRGLPVPASKRSYISLDAAREAHARDIAFGRLNDPVGRPTERGLALMPLAECAGQGERYVASFMRGVWAEGIDAGSDRGLRKIVERAGLPWNQARLALKHEGWRDTAERNREALFGLGLWGVPSFAVGDTAVWGQDRLWLIEQALRGYAEDQDRPISSD